MMRVAPSLLLSVALGACTSAPPTKDGVENNGFVVTGCSGDQCDVSITVDMSDLQDCLGWDSVYGWPPGTPQGVIDNCSDPNLVDCEIDYTGVTFSGEEVETLDPFNPCGCEADTGLDRADDCCIFTPDGELGDLKALLDACVGPQLYSIDTTNCELDVVEDECAAGAAVATAPGADIVLYVDETQSYVTVTSPSDSETVNVQGGGSAGVQPDYFMSALVWSDPGTLGSNYMSDWMFWFTAPVAMDLSGGSFTVDATTAPLFRGSGLQNGDIYNMDLVMGQDATGTIDNTNLAWELDFSQTS